MTMAPLAKPSLLAIQRFMVEDGVAEGTNRVHGVSSAEVTMAVRMPSRRPFAMTVSIPSAAVRAATRFLVIMPPRPADERFVSIYRVRSV